MPGRKKQDSASQSEAGKGGQPTKRPITLGTDPALTLPTPQGNTLQLSYWDLWFALVAVKDFGGDLDRLAERLGQKQRFQSFDRRSAERKRSHLRDLQRRLDEASVTPDQIATAAGDLARTELRRARSRVLEHSEREREWSVPRVMGLFVGCPPFPASDWLAESCFFRPGMWCSYQDHAFPIKYSGQTLNS